MTPEIVTLTPEERNKVATYLEQEAVSQDGLARQLEGLPTKEIGEQIAKKYRTEALAFRVTAKWLRSWEKA